MLHLKVYLFISDQGGDQVAAKRLILDDVAGRADVMVLSHFCYAHQDHLMVNRERRGR